MSVERGGGFREAVIRHAGIIRVTAKIEFVYRFNFVTSVIWSLISMSLVYFLWTAIYRSSASMAMTEQALITYVCLGQAFSFARPGQRGIFTRIGQGIRSGDILLDLVRPSDYQAMTFSGIFGSFLMDAVMVAVPSYILALAVFRISAPVSAAAAAGFVASLGAAYFMIASLDFLLGLMAFWTTSIWGLGYAKMAVMDVLAGSIVPLSLFPGWLRGVVLALPFKDMAYTPLAIYVGQISGTGIWMSILVQIGWATGFVLFTRLLWGRARRRIEIQGG